LRGKFEELRGDGDGFNPLSSALVEAFSGLVSQCDGPGELDSIRESILTYLGGLKSAGQFASMFPALGPLLSRPGDNHHDHHHDGSITDAHTSSGELAMVGETETLTTNDDTGPKTPTTSNDGSKGFSRLSDRSLLSSGASIGSLGSLAVRRDRVDSARAVNRLIYMFRSLALAICGNPLRPVILFLDDLQWCGSGSMEILEALLLDKDLRHFMFVGAWRRGQEEEREFLRDSNNKNSTVIDLRRSSNDQNNNGIDSKKSKLHDKWETIQKAHPHMAKIELANLSLDGLTIFLKSVLKMEDHDEETYDDDNDGEADSRRVAELAKTLYQKTAGNIFFTRQILEELHAKGHLSFCRMTFVWEWNIDKIDILDNVLEAVTQRIRTTTSTTLQKILTTAAYMRHTVSVDSLKLMMALQEMVLSEKELTRELNKAVSDGFLINAKFSRLYRFSHDRIQEAAYRMIPEGETRDEFRYNIGTSLFKMSKDPRLGEDWMLLAAADHLNATFTKDPLFLAKLNLEAGEKCISVAAFASASKCLSFARKRLCEATQDPWTDHYDLSLDIYSLVAEAELARGNWDVGQEVAEAVLEHARCIDDKLPTQIVFAKALGRKKSHIDSLLTSLNTLQSMGVYRKTSLGVYIDLVKDLIYIKRYFKSHTNDEILSIHFSQDARLGFALELMGNAIHQAFFCGRVADFLALALKALRLSFKHGLFPQSPRVCMTYSMVCDASGDFEGARRFAKLGLDMMAQSSDKSMYGWLLYLKTVFFDSWTEDPSTIAKLYETSCKRSMEIGDFESALISECGALDHEFLAGRSLVLLDIRFANLVEKEEIYCQSLKLITEQQWLPVRHLRGTSDTPLDFDALANFDKDVTDKICLSAGFSSRLIIAVFWGNYEFAEKILAKASPVRDKSYNGKVPRLFFETIVFNTLHRTTGRKAFRKKGKAALSELETLSEAKGRNSLHRCTIARAHVQACSKRKKSRDMVLRLYDEGIEAAIKSNHKQDAALASQLAAEYIVWVDAAEAKSVANYLQNARAWYRDWGAANLVRHLEKKYASYLGN